MMLPDELRQVLDCVDVTQLLIHVHQLLRHPDVGRAQLDGLEVARAGVCDVAAVWVHCDVTSVYPHVGVSGVDS